MEFKQAAAEIRKTARLYGAFAYIEQVLDAASNAEAATARATKRLAEERAEIEVVEAAVEETVREHEAAMREAVATLEKVHVEINEAEDAGRYAAEIRMDAVQAAAEEGWAKHEARVKRWGEECRVLEMRHTALEDQLTRAREEWAKMRKRIGVK